jgi:hypothetical protein
MGVLTLFLPFYAVSTGNWRLKTEKRRLLAGVWWGAFVLLWVGLALRR